MTVQNIFERLREARAPYATSKVFFEARVHNACLDAEAEIERLRAALAKIRYLEASDADTWIWQASEEAREALEYQPATHEQNAIEATKP